MVQMNDYRAYVLAKHQDELMHFGILGMKWGVRRYQNPDGSLTPLGQKRYRKKEIKEAKKERKEAIRKTKQDIRDSKKRLKLLKKDNQWKEDPKEVLKRRYDMSNQELQEAIDRIDKVQKLQNQRRSQLSEPKRWADFVLSYVKTMNEAYKMYNSDVGKALRKGLGFDIPKEEKKEETKQERKDQEDQKKKK